MLHEFREKAPHDIDPDAVPGREVGRCPAERRAQVLIDDWREEYNTYRPHQSLRYLTPSAFARQWRVENEGRVSQRVDR